MLYLKIFYYNVGYLKYSEFIGFSIIKVPIYREKIVFIVILQVIAQKTTYAHNSGLTVNH